MVFHQPRSGVEGEAPRALPVEGQTPALPERAANPKDLRSLSTRAPVIDVHDVCDKAFRLMAEKQFSAAEQLLSNCLTKSDDPVSIALLHSACGVSAKLQQKPKEALRHYQRAEKILPDDPSLKLITAQLLIDEFAEYDLAIKRCVRAEKLLPNNPVMLHHAKTIEGLACARRGNKAKAVACLRASCDFGFRGFVTVHNIDFQLVHICLKKNWEVSLCRAFLQSAHAFAHITKESTWIRTLGRMLEALPA